MSHFPFIAWKCVLLWDNSRLIPFLSPCLSGEQRARNVVESGFENRLEHLPVWLYWHNQRGWMMRWCYLWECPENGRRARTHVALSSHWRSEPYSWIIWQYLFSVGMAERNICFCAGSWIAVEKITARTRADLCMARVHMHPHCA